MCTVNSSTWNSAVLSHLVKAQNGWTTEVYADFAFLTSNISSIESASVPAAMDELALLISQHIGTKEFREMEINKVTSWLNDNSEVRKKLQEFIQKHGHRCIKEVFNVHIMCTVNSSTWNSAVLSHLVKAQNGNNISV
ncbi:uncharacterized protein LOC111613195 [Centruroides sculpturatus]|uniref:uncharacterized protein LOC111613195 n=1 Tax=Centruroides sculpturatus TaxID=218467 RepID=UPI000C6CA7E4|nr:uncharacterized protein LOC111613195 [Centruroides sculpturatus]